MKDIILNEGELICPICDGSGNDKKNIFVCEKCDGDGKVDWVSNVISQNKSMTTMDRINIRSMISDIKTSINNLKDQPLNHQSINYVKASINNYLSTTKMNKVIYDYRINNSFVKEYNFEVVIQPKRSREIITMCININL